MHYATQWNFIILRKFSHMTLSSPNEKWMRVADMVRRFCHFLSWWGEFCFNVVGNFEPKKITPNWNALAKSIISYLWVSYFTFVFSWQCKTMLFTHKKNMQWRQVSRRFWYLTTLSFRIFYFFWRYFRIKHRINYKLMASLST